MEHERLVREGGPDPRLIVRGERVGLSTPTEEEFVARWPLFNDAQMMMVAMGPVASPGTPSFVSMPPVSRRQRERMWESFVTIRAMLPFDIWDLEQGRVVGEILLDAIQWPDATCELTVWLFDPADRGRGLGSEATRLAAGYGFDGLGLHRMCIRFLAGNPAVVGAVTHWAESFGARQYGREREKRVRVRRLPGCDHVRSAAPRVSSPPRDGAAPRRPLAAPRAARGKVARAPRAQLDSPGGSADRPGCAIPGA